MNPNIKVSVQPLNKRQFVISIKETIVSPRQEEKNEKKIKTIRTLTPILTASLPSYQLF